MFRPRLNGWCLCWVIHQKKKNYENGWQWRKNAFREHLKGAVERERNAC